MEEFTVFFIPINHERDLCKNKKKNAYEMNKKDRSSREKIYGIVIKKV